MNVQTARTRICRSPTWTAVRQVNLALLWFPIEYFSKSTLPPLWQRHLFDRAQLLHSTYEYRREALKNQSIIIFDRQMRDHFCVVSFISMVYLIRFSSPKQPVQSLSTATCWNIPSMLHDMHIVLPSSVSKYTFHHRHETHPERYPNFLSYRTKDRSVQHERFPESKTFVQNKTCFDVRRRLHHFLIGCTDCS